MVDLRDKVLQFRSKLRGAFFERNGVIDGLFAAAIAGEHVLLLGPPGTGKSALARAFCEGVSGSEYFEWLLSKFTAPEELYGPLHLAKLKEGTYQRVTTNKLPRCHVAFLDEIFKSNSGVLNSLLTAINERKFHDGTGANPIPLKLVVGASNELPEGAELAALYDRFLLRYWVDRIGSGGAFVEMLMTSDPSPEALITLSDWEQAQAEAAALPVVDGTYRTLFKLRRQLQKEGIEPSDRRLKRCVKLARAVAWLEGAAQVTSEHLAILSNALWSEMGEMEKVQTLVEKQAQGVGSEARKVVEGFRDLMAGVVENGQLVLTVKGDELHQRLIALNKDGGVAASRLSALRESAGAITGAAEETLREAGEELEALRAPLREITRQTLGL